METPVLSAGDIVEITTPAGLCYVQVTHLHRVYPEVIRVLPGVRATRPDTFAGLVGSPTSFVALCPLAAALAREAPGAARVGSAPVPDADRSFPLFRLPIRDRAGEIVYHWFWDGDGLSLDQPAGVVPEALPLREITPVAALARRMAGGWTAPNAKATGFQAGPV